MNKKCKIIVLKTIRHLDGDLIVHGLSSEGTKMSFFAKGAAKSRRRFAGGVLEPLHYIEVTYRDKYQRDEDPLFTLLEAQVVREFLKIREDYDRIEMAIYFVKTIHRLTGHGLVESPDIFNLLGNALAALESSNDLSKLRLAFDLKLLAGQGVLPDDADFSPLLAKPLSDHESVTLSRDSQARARDLSTHYLRNYLDT